MPRRKPVTGVEHPQWKHGRYSGTAKEVTTYLRGELGEVARTLTRSDDLTEEVRLVRVLIVRALEQHGAQLLTSKARLTGLLNLLGRLEKLVRTNQRLRQSKAASREERVILMDRVMRVVINHVPPQARPDLHQAVQSRLGLVTAQGAAIPLRPPAAAPAEGAGEGTAPGGVTARLSGRARQIAAELEEADDLADEVHLVRTLVGGFVSTYQESLLEVDEATSSLPLLDPLLELLTRLERLVDANRQVHESQAMILEEMVVWAGIVISEAQVYVTRETLPQFRDEVRRILGVDLREITTLWEVQRDHGQWREPRFGARDLLTDSEGQG